MTRVLIVLAVGMLLTVSTQAGDLYKVQIHSQQDADRLVAVGAEPVLVVRDGYLVLTDPDQAERLDRSGLTSQLLASGLKKEQLALDNRRDEKNLNRFPVVYKDGNLHLFQLDQSKSAALEDGSSLIPIRTENLVIRYHAPRRLNEAAVFQGIGLTELIARVSFDTIYSHLHYLQSLNGRVAGSSSSYAARDWIKAKLQAYGYTTTTPSFWANVYGYNKQCFNVVATKTGTVFPKRQVVIGAHYDAVPGSPGVDDNGTGTAGVLEIARALSTLETDMSYVFVLFDSEEQGLNGAWNYANAAAARGDSIVCMLNLDMIGNITNSGSVDLSYGPEVSYAELWGRLADSLVNISAYFTGEASNSDHYAFQQNGYDVVFAIEHEFSAYYHTPRDSTAYINYLYCTKVIKATLATAYTVSLSPLAVQIVSVRDGGDGQSLMVTWQADDPGNVDHYMLYYEDQSTLALDSMSVPAGNTSAFLTGLTEGTEYRLFVVVYNAQGYGAVVYNEVFGTPYSRPARPQQFTAMPRYRAVVLNWKGNNTELDFDHYAIMRDGKVLPDAVTDTFYIDDDFVLGADYHDYLIVAVDAGGLISDTTGAVPVSMRAATLRPGHILAVNRSNRSNPYMVNEVVTGEFMRDALQGYDFDYYSDTASRAGNDTAALNLVDMLDYEVVMLGGESARTDDFAGAPGFGGKLDTIGYYLSIGGKVVLFGRFGDVTVTADRVDTITFAPGNSDYGYKSYFHMNARVQYLTPLSGSTMDCDLVGAHSQAAEFPDLFYDSLVTVNHSVPWTGVNGIPCPSFALMSGGQPEILYTYDSRVNLPLTEGKPVAWRYSGSGSQYVFFEIPLSFMQRDAAKAALLAAVNWMLSAGPAGAAVLDPDTIDIPGVHPDTLTIYVGDFVAGRTAADVDPATVRIDATIVPLATTILPSQPPFSGAVLAVSVNAAEFIDAYSPVTDTVNTVYTVSWQFVGEPKTNIIDGAVTLFGFDYLAGDANGDGLVNIGDAVFIVNYIFKSGAAPQPEQTGDADCDGNVNVGDAVYLINFIFKSGPAPDCW